MTAAVLETVPVTASGSYDVVVGRRLLDELGQRVRAAAPDCDDAVLLVSDTNVAPIYGDRACASLENAGFTVHAAVVPAGEATKSLSSYCALQELAASASLSRRSTVVALGGGVVGDLAGFAAATYMRGCNLVQVPTSLLAMVDSSVGGKTAVDLPQGKNLTGAFWQPKLVLCDLDCLASLPATYLSDGTGEVVKYAVMADAELFEWLSRPVVGQEGRVVGRCVRIKRDVVQADEHESGARKLLNLGHTVGHAVELLGEYRIPHGHAVAAGTAVMARACAAKGWCSYEDTARIEALLRAQGLPCGTRRTPAQIAQAALRDKKRAGDHIDVVVVRGIGSTEVRRVTLAEFEELVELGCRAADVTFAEDGPFVGDGAPARPAPGAPSRPQASAAPEGLGTLNPREPLGSAPVAVRVLPQPLAGSVPAIASKSAAHRMLVCAALADAPTRVRCSTTSQDIEATAACLRALGARVERDGDDLVVEPVDRTAAADGGPMAQLPCGESGSTLRFMLPVACALGGAHAFHMAGRLPERPLEPLRTRLVEHGCQVSPQGVQPLVQWGALEGGTFDLPGNVSSQYVTGLLLALPLTEQGGCVRLAGAVESRPYIDLTLAVMRAFGVQVEEGSDFSCGEVDGGEVCTRLTTFTVPADARYTSPGSCSVEGDWSNAAFWLCAGALSADPAGVEVTGLDLASTQGDRAVLDVLRAMGAAVAEKPEAGAARVAAGDLADVTIDAHDVPDLVPVLAVTAAAARGTTRVVNAARLRIKESDRLATTAELLRALGVQVEELPDGLVIEGLAGAPFSACTVSAHGDHRIAMAAAVAATRADGPVTVDGAQAVAKSYPAFFADLLDLGGAVLLNAGAAAGPGAPRE